MQSYSKSARKKSVKYNRKTALVVLSVLAIPFILLILELTDTTHIFHKRKLVSSTIPASTNAQVSNGSSETSNSDKSKTNTQVPDSNPVSDKTVGLPSSGSDLLNPSGSFVSSHRPSLKDFSSMESVCISTPGANCTITFTLGNVVKTLETKKSDNSGTVVWNWDIKKAGFVEGTWQITATASFNGQSKSATDLQPLEVQP